MKLITKIIPIFALPLVLCSLSVAQPNVDLQVSVQLSSESARGGEPFSFTVQVNNRGSGKAADAVVNAHPDGHYFDITSALSQKGTCEATGEQFESRWLCRLGDIAAGEVVTITFAGKMLDIDEPIPVGVIPGDTPAIRQRVEAGAKAVESIATMAAAMGSKVDREKNIAIPIGTIYAFPDGDDLNEEDNSATVRVQTLPSRNMRPQVAITAPQADAVLVRPARKTTTVEISIEAFDSDGAIEKVVVLDPKDRVLPVPGAGHWEFLYHDKKYTAAELEDFLRSNPQPESLARRIGKNKYVYSVTNPAWGRNRIEVTATDNGGRTSRTSVDFDVRGDATVEIVTPKQDQIVEPGSTLTVETETTLNEGPIKEMFLVGDVESKTRRMPLELVSKKGNVYRHRCVLKNVRENSVYSSVRAILEETSGAITESKGVGFLPRRVPKIQFTNIRDGQVFQKPKQIEILFSDVEDGTMDADYELHIDGKYRSRVFQGFIWRSPEPGTHTIEIVVRFGKLDGPEIGRSGPITVHVR